MLKLTKEVLKGVISCLIDECSKNHQSVEPYAKELEESYTGISAIFKEIRDSEKEKAEKDCKDIIKELDSIFLPHNKTLCPECKNCCCTGCWDARGHFHLNPNYTGSTGSIAGRAAINEKMKKYEWGPNGFLGPNGCTLPRAERSETCLFHICGKMQEALGKEGNARFTHLREKYYVAVKKLKRVIH